MKDISILEAQALAWSEGEKPFSELSPEEVQVFWGFFERATEELDEARRRSPNPWIPLLSDWLVHVMFPPAAFIPDEGAYDGPVPVTAFQRELPS